MSYDLVYLVVTGSTSAYRTPALVQGLLLLAPRVLTLLTPNAERVIAPRELSRIEGNVVVESYFDAAILPRPPHGVVVVAPCTFNTLNKLAAGVADNLALSVVAEAIGRQTPVIVGVAVNEPLLRHPRAVPAMATLRSWGVHVIEPYDENDVILAEVARQLR